MGWSLEVNFISGAILNVKKYRVVKGERKRDVRSKFKYIYCHPEGNDKEDDKAAESFDFEECHFSISKSLELPAKSREIFPHKIYLLSIVSN